MEDGVTEETKADLPKLKKYFADWQTLTSEGRAENVIEIDYYDGIQLTKGEKLVLSKRGQPDIVINRIRPAINGILGVIQRGKSEPRAYPRTPKDEGSSDVATDTLRFISDENRFPATKIRCFKDMLVPGSTAAQVLVDPDLKVKIEQVRWEEFFYDPRSRREDFGDARYLGIARWMSADDVKALYPDKAEEIEDAVSTGPMAGGGLDTTTQDRPASSPQVWVDRKRRRLFVVEVYYREGQAWERCVYLSTVILAEGASPYQDDKGVPICPIEAVSAYLDRENNRYGAVRDMRDVQDEINKRRSKALWRASMRQVQESAPGSGMGTAEEASTQASRPDGALPSGWQVVPADGSFNAELQLLQEAKGEIERLGPNPAILGREGADASGRALQSRQQSGLVELAILFGHLEDWELRIYRQCWARAKQFWTAPQFIRVTDDEGAPQFVGLNQPRGQPVIDPQTGQPAMDPKTGQPMEGPPEIDPMNGGAVLGYKNVVAEMDVDIIIDSTPDTANIQAEQFQDLMQLVGSNPTYAQSVPFEMMLELSAVPHKRELIDKLKTYRERGRAQQAQMAQQAQEMQGAELTATIRKTDSETALNTAKTATEQLKPQIEAAQLGLDAHAQMMQPPPQPSGPPMQQGPPPGF